jgi:hypothetical protein
MLLPDALDFSLTAVLEPPSDCDIPGFACDGGCALEHSKVHAWYHGTIDGGSSDGDCTVDPAWYDGTNPHDPGCRTWDCQGFHYAQLGGGATDRPALPASTADPGDFPIVFNGDFEAPSAAGWAFHGGGGSGSLVNEGGRFLKLGAGAGASRTHNRFWLPAEAQALALRYRVFTADTSAGDDALTITLTDTLGNPPYAAPVSVPLDATSPDWLPLEVPLVPWLPAARAYTLTFAIDSGAALQAVVGVDDVAVAVLACPWDCQDAPNGFVDIADMFRLFGHWGGVGPCDFGGNGPGDIADLFEMFGNWGPCP